MMCHLIMGSDEFGKRKSKRYAVLDLGDRVSVDILLNESPSGLVLELQRDNPLHPRIVVLKRLTSGTDTSDVHHT
jgi:hypothetical protein